MFAFNYFLFFPERKRKLAQIRKVGSRECMFTFEFNILSLLLISGINNIFTQKYIIRL